MLQDNVKQTIENLMDAKIKVWMLTGDKGATAQQIAKSCGILKPKMALFEIDEERELFGSLSAMLEDVEMLDGTHHSHFYKSNCVSSKPQRKDVNKTDT